MDVVQKDTCSCEQFVWQVYLRYKRSSFQSVYINVTCTGYVCPGNNIQKTNAIYHDQTVTC